MKKIQIQVGCGNIGRACVGRLFHNAGYYVYFLDIDEELLALLHERKQYHVQVLGKRTSEIHLVDHVDRMPKDESDLAQVYSDVEIVTTAVGVTVLPNIVPFFVALITHRYQHNITRELNIIACENAVRASSLLKEHIYQALPTDVRVWADSHIAFPNAVTDSIVPSVKNKDPLLVIGEDFADLTIEDDAFLGDGKEEIEAVEGLSFKNNLDAYIERKLFTLNTGHAITAYLGVQRGFTTIKEAIANHSIYEAVKSAMLETGEVLIKKYALDREPHLQYIEKILTRLENPHLDDSVRRVGREPLRKLSYNDRFILPLRDAVRYGINHDNLIKGIVAALQFYDEDDAQSKEMKVLLSEGSIQEGISRITGLSHDQQEKTLASVISNQFIKDVKERY